MGMADIKEIKNDVKGNNSKIDELTSKVENLEAKSKEAEDTTTEKFNQIKEEIGKVEENVTSKLLKEIEPSLNAMKGEMQTSMGIDIRRIVQEELSLREMKEKRNSEAAAKPEEEPPANKNTK